jgi:penicillin-binding protein 1A
LIENFEYVIYRAKLEVVEISRINVNFESLKSILIDIEDKSFYTNNGVSIKSIIRATISQVKFLRNAFGLLESGGSTITMQLARTLFIPTNQNKYIRKFFEIWISLWLQRSFTKQEILNLYIASVRYDYGVLGLSKAIKHFYGNLNNKILTPEECFVLIERLSNVTGTLRKERIKYLISKSSVNLDVGKIFDIYLTLKDQGKIKK